MNKQEIIDGLQEILSVALYSCSSDDIERFDKILKEAIEIINNAT